ncbi:MAG: T9SS type A sorting domain-containing protein [Chitinophagaceae bacterium]|nr:T9SS type A sorting domain-containing protein [Chitinophagaceae bacterium]
MKKRLINVPILLFLLLSVVTGYRSSAQCTNANINWDNLDYLQRNTAGYSTYITAGMFANMVQTQRFAIGTNRVTIATNFLTAAITGENATHTGSAGSNGAGEDVAFNANGTITMTFDTAVSNVLFSLYDIDLQQVATITAFEGVTARPVVLTKPAGGNLVIAGNVATAPNVAQGNASTVGTLNVAVAGPLTSITIVITGTAGNFWLSDIQACVYRNFPTDYYAISQPFTGQPAYILAVHDLNTIYMLDPATGRAVSLFTDTDPRVKEINDLAYDPYKRILYYSIDGLERCTPAGTADSIRHIKTYDFNTETITKIIANVNNAPFNIPTFSYGLESAAGAFYNGSLYQGAEGTQSGSTSTGREGIVWRIDFAGDSVTPTQACQVFALPADNGSSLTHDWGDVVIKDGILYDFNATSAASVGNYNVYNLQTGAINTYAGLSLANKPRQSGQQWNGNLVWAHDSVTTYNGTNILGATKYKIVAAPRSVTWVAGAGDVAEAFRPKADFGDAPASYDPVALSPALNEKDTAIRIGTTYDWEWSKNTSADASGDGSDEDGLAYVPIYAKLTNQYVAQVQVWNNSGANGTLCAWLDYNGNGLFDASEGITPITVTTMASYQSFYLAWTGITTPLSNNDVTYLRIRFTSAANTLTTASSTGYFNDGETEDYQVIIDDYPLTVGMITFNAMATNNSTVKLNWTTTTEKDLAGFAVERSADGTNWTLIGFVNAKGNGRSENTDYTFTDVQALKGKSYYRLKISDLGTAFKYSEVRQVFIKDLAAGVSISPNPAKTQATIVINSEANADAVIVFHDMQGRNARTEKHHLFAGGNSITINNLDQLPDGLYNVQIITGQQIINRKLIIGKSIF